MAKDKRSMNKTYVMIDANHLAWRSFYLLGKKIGIGKSLGVSNAICYGFVNTITNLSKVFKSKNIICVWDSPPYWRHQIYKDYKGNRKPKEDVFKAAMILCKQMLKDIGVCQLAVDGFEADDLAGIYSHLLNKKGHKVIIVTEDKDYYQLLRKGVKIFRPNANEIMTVKKFKKEYPGLKPIDIVLMKAITGCTSDHVKGIKGIGDKTVMKFIAEYNTLKKMLKNQEEIEKIRGCSKLFSEDNIERIKFNRVLVKIPNSDKDIESHIEKGHISKKRIKKLFEKIMKKREIKRKKLSKTMGKYGLRKFKTKVVKGDGLMGLEIV